MSLSVQVYTYAGWQGCQPAILMVKHVILKTVFDSHDIEQLRQVHYFHQS